MTSVFDPDTAPVVETVDGGTIDCDITVAAFRSVGRVAVQRDTWLAVCGYLGSPPFVRPGSGDEGDLEASALSGASGHGPGGVGAMLTTVSGTSHDRPALRVRQPTNRLSGPHQSPTEHIHLIN